VSPCASNTGKSCGFRSRSIIGTPSTSVRPLKTRVWRNKTREWRTMASMLRYLYSTIGKYAFGSCGASGALSATHRRYAVGNAGGDLASSYTLCFDVTVAMADARSSDPCETAGILVRGVNT
jgi:hypothetical protein